MSAQCQGEAAWTKMERFIDDHEPMAGWEEIEAALGVNIVTLSYTCFDFGAGDCPWFPLCEVMS